MRAAWRTEPPRRKNDQRVRIGGVSGFKQGCEQQTALIGQTGVVAGATGAPTCPELALRTTARHDVCERRDGLPPTVALGVGATMI